MQNKGLLIKFWAKIFFIFLFFYAPFTFLFGFELTRKEQEWLSANQDKINLWYDRKFPPIEFKSPKGDFQGLGADVMHLIEARLGLSFKVTPSQNWIGQLKALETGEAAIIPVIVRTLERERFAFFSKPYINIPVVIITARDRNEQTMEDFKGLKVAAVKGYVSEGYLLKNYSDTVQIMPVGNVQEGLRDVAFGVVDAFLENLAVAAYYLDQEKLPNLRVAGNTELGYPLSFAVSRHYPLLFSAMHKAYLNISEEKMAAIGRHWIPISQPETFTEKQLELIKTASFFVMTIILTLFITSWVLKHRLRNEMESVKKAREEQQKSENIVMESEQRFKSVFDNAPYSIAINRFSDGAFLDVNKAFTDHWGDTKENVMKMEFHDISGVSKEEARKIRKNIYNSGGIHKYGISADGKKWFSSIHPFFFSSHFPWWRACCSVIYR